MTVAQLAPAIHVQGLEKSFKQLHALPGAIGEAQNAQ